MAKRKMSKKRAEAILKNYPSMAEHYTTLRSEELTFLLDYEKATKNRESFLRRLLQRFCTEERKAAFKKYGIDSTAKV